MLAYDKRTKQLEIEGYTIPKGREMLKTEKMQAYLAEGIKTSHLPRENRDRLQHYLHTVNKVVNTTKIQQKCNKERAAVKRPMVKLPCNFQFSITFDKV